MKNETFCSTDSLSVRVFCVDFGPVDPSAGVFTGPMNGRDAAAKQIQKRGLTGLHLISRMLKVRLKQICCE